MDGGGRRDSGMGPMGPMGGHRGSMQRGSFTAGAGGRRGSVAMLGGASNANSFAGGSMLPNINGGSGGAGPHRGSFNTTHGSGGGMAAGPSGSSSMMRMPTGRRVSADRRVSAVNVRANFSRSRLSTLQTLDENTMNAAETMKLLKQVRLFQQLPQHTCDYLVSHSTRETVRRGQLMFQEGDEGSSFYAILSGELAVYQRKPTEIVKQEGNYDTLGEDVNELYGTVVNVLEEGHCFGELALISDDSVRHGSVVGLAEDTSLMVISKKVYDSVLKRNLNVQHLAENYFAILKAPANKRTAMDIQALVQVTKRHTFFQQLPIEAVEQLCHNLKLKKFSKESVIFKQGNLITGRSCCYIVLKGSLSLHAKEGVEIIDYDQKSEEESSGASMSKEEIRRSSLFRTTVSSNTDIEATFGNCMTSFHPGDFFGEGALLNYDRRKESAICREETYVMVLTRDQCKAVIGKLGTSMSFLIQPEMMSRILFKSPKERTEEELEELVMMMQNFAFFAPLEKKEQLEVVRVTKCLKLGADEIVMQQGDPGDAFYIIISGSVGIHQISAQALQLHREAGEARRERLTVEQFYGACIRVLSKGASFGETALLKGEPRNATVISVEPTELMVVLKDDYDRIIKKVEAEKLKENLDFLSRVSIVGKMPVVELTKLSYFLQTEVIHINACPVVKGQCTEGLYIIAGGAFKVVTDDPHRPGQVIEISILGPGEMFGLSAVSNEAEAFTVKSTSHSEVYILQCTDIPGALSWEYQQKIKTFQRQQTKWQMSRVNQITSVRENTLSKFFKPSVFSGRQHRLNNSKFSFTPPTSLPSTAFTQLRRSAGRTLTPLPPIASNGAASAGSAGQGGGQAVSIRDHVKSGGPRKGRDSFARSKGGKGKKAGLSENGRSPQMMAKPRSTMSQKLVIDVDLASKKIKGCSPGYVRLVCGKLKEEHNNAMVSTDPYVKQRQLLDYTRDLIRRTRGSETAIAV